ncbi:hypothetical protein DWY88_13160 [Mediterraneibacter gnavus]|uniref:Uncharacterized protein n=1 Tax=Mediterraneibacter gnavus TaxID=33038 RepID=A0A412BV78_MEDGN|nr:hypothetical protein DWY88_13160 [Mediterraneibacter gnavus]
MPSGNTVKHGWILLLFVSLYITKRSEAVLQWGKRKNIKKMMINHFFRHDRKRNCKSASRVCDRCRFFRTIKQ